LAKQFSQKKMIIFSKTKQMKKRMIIFSKNKRMEITGSGKQLGKRGEKESIAFLKKKGFKILETNYRTKMAEIDIIAKDHGTICFMEVKTRRSTRKGLPKEAVTRTKQNKIIQAAIIYLKKAGQTETKARFDVVEVQEADAKLSFNIIKNAFQTG
jgi:putative endonuclease